MVKWLKENWREIVVIVATVLSVIFLILGINQTDEEMKQNCIKNCNNYHMLFLKSEKVSDIGFACFCLDVDGKPKQVPAG